MNKRVKELEAEIAKTEKQVTAAILKVEALKAAKDKAAKAKTLDPTQVKSKLDQIYGLIKELEQNAEASGNPFNFGVSYGMGGTFGPDYDDPSQWRWRSSSEGC